MPSPRSAFTPLAIDSDDWRRRWLQIGDGVRLHRVSEIEWDEDAGVVSGQGMTACGQRGRLIMPGIFSRMGAPRCPKCCKALGIPNGDGAPYNALEGDAKDA